MFIERVGVLGFTRQIRHFTGIIAHVHKRFSEVAFTVHTILVIDAAKHTPRVVLRDDVVAPVSDVL